LNFDQWLAGYGFPVMKPEGQLGRGIAALQMPDPAAELCARIPDPAITACCVRGCKYGSQNSLNRGAK